MTSNQWVDGSSPSVSALVDYFLNFKIIIMILHLFAAIVVIIAFLLIKYYNKILDWMDKVWDFTFYKLEERKDLKRHKGMYDYYHDEE